MVITYNWFCTHIRRNFSIHNSSFFYLGVDSLPKKISRIAHQVISSHCKNLGIHLWLTLSLSSALTYTTYYHILLCLSFLYFFSLLSILTPYWVFIYPLHTLFSLSHTKRKKKLHIRKTHSFNLLLNPWFLNLDQISRSISWIRKWPNDQRPFQNWWELVQKIRLN